MNNTAKKAAAILTAAFVAASFAGCGKKNVDSGNNSQSSAAADSKVVAEVDGVKLDTGLLGYYIYQAAVNEEYKADQNFSGDFSSVNWDEKDSSGTQRATREKRQVLKNCLANSWWFSLQRITVFHCRMMRKISQQRDLSSLKAVTEKRLSMPIWRQWD